MVILFKRILVFMGLLTCCYLLLISGISTFGGGHDFQYYLRKYSNIPTGLAQRGDNSMVRFREIHAYHDVDILFVGSSHCYRGYDPRFFQHKGLRVFNMGSTGQTPLTSYYLLRQYGDDLNPKLMVLDLYWTMMQQDGAESTLDLLVNVETNWNIVKMVLATKNILAVNALLSDCLNFRQPPLAEVSPVRSTDDTYVPGGFVETTRNALLPEVELAPYTITIHPLQLKYLERIIQSAQKEGIEVVLVTSPVSSAYRNSIINYELWSSTIFDLSQRYHLQHIDFNHDEFFTSSPAFFYDRDHLNTHGVREFNKRFYQRLLMVPEFQKAMGVRNIELQIKRTPSL